eukprot:7044637-Prymnesium_polylepis.1
MPARPFPAQTGSDPLSRHANPVCEVACRDLEGLEVLVAAGSRRGSAPHLESNAFKIVDELPRHRGSPQSSDAVEQ